MHSSPAAGSRAIGAHLIFQSHKDLYRDSPCHAWLQALEDTQGKDLLFWANRYHLFVSWSSDRSHPWDAKQAASEYVTLEIGVARGAANKVRARAWGSSMTV